MGVLNCDPSSTVGTLDLRTPCPLALGTHREGSRKGLKQEVELSGGCVYPCSGWAAHCFVQKSSQPQGWVALLLATFRNLPWYQQL